MGDGAGEVAAVDTTVISRSVFRVLASLRGGVGATPLRLRHHLSTKCRELVWIAQSEDAVNGA